MARQNRVGIALIALVAWAVLTMGIAALQTTGNTTLNQLVTSNLLYGVVAAGLFLLVLAIVLRWQRGVGFLPVDMSSLKLTWFPVLLIVLFLTGATLLGLPPLQIVLLVFINTLLVGFSEELMFRGVLLFALVSRTGIIASVAVSSVLFGGIHTLNVILTGDFAGAATQALAAGMSGVLFAALRIRNRSIIPAMVLHGLWDFSVFMMSSAVERLGTAPASPAPNIGPAALFLPILFVLPNFLYGLWLLRHAGKEDKATLFPGSV